MKIKKWAVTPQEVTLDVPSHSQVLVYKSVAPKDAKGFLRAIHVDVYVYGLRYYVIIDGSLYETIEREGDIVYDPPVVYSVLEIYARNDTDASVPVGLRIDAIFAKPVP